MTQGRPAIRPAAKTRRLLLAGLALALTAAAPPPVPDAAGGDTVLARTEITPAGTKQRLEAELGLVPVGSGQGDADATGGYLSYSRPGAPASRPVLFAFNGGPGAASAFLHMGVLGPVLAPPPADPTVAISPSPALVASDAGLWDKADLVFLDPPGTGLSKVGPAADKAFYASTAGDASAVAQVVGRWLADHHRQGAPVYILGESYGTIRAVAMLDALARLPDPPRVRGVILLGQALNMIETSQRPDNVIAYAVALPTLARIACYHHKAKAPCDGDRIAAEASKFAAGEYLEALYAGSALDAASRRRVALRLQDLTGIPAAWYEANDLRISKERFRVALLRGEDEVTGRYDARYLMARPANAGEVVGPDPFGKVSDAYGEAMPRYLARTFKGFDASAYQAIVRGEGTWAYGGADSPFADWPFMATFERHAAADKCLRLFVGTGIYDLTTTTGAADYLFAQSDLAPARYEKHEYVGGHVFYSDPDSRHKLIADLGAFIARDGCS